MLFGSVALSGVSAALQIPWDGEFRLDRGIAVAIVDNIVSAVAGLLSLALVVVFLVWLYRVSSNARSRFPAAGIRPGWTVGWFFIPLANLVMPYFEARKGWQAQVQRDTGPLIGWWLPWAFTGVLGLLAFPIVAYTFIESLLAGLRTSSPESLVEDIYGDVAPLLLTLDFLTFAFQAIAAVFLVRVVRRWTAAQTTLPAPAS